MNLQKNVRENVPEGNERTFGTERFGKWNSRTMILVIISLVVKTNNSSLGNKEISWSTIWTFVGKYNCTFAPRKFLFVVPNTVSLNHSNILENNLWSFVTVNTVFISGLYRTRSVCYTWHGQVGGVNESYLALECNFTWKWKC